MSFMERLRQREKRLRNKLDGLDGFYHFFELFCFRRGSKVS